MIDGDLIKVAWLNAKANYVKTEKVLCRSSIVTFGQWKLRKELFRDKIRAMKNLEPIKKAQKTNAEKEKAQDPEQPAMKFDENDFDWVMGECDVTNTYSCENFFADIKNRCLEQYMDELGLIIMFQIFMVSEAYALKVQKRKYLFSFLRNKKEILYACGIHVSVPTEGSEGIKYAMVINQIKKLTPEQQTLFNKLRLKSIQDERVRD